MNKHQPRPEQTQAMKSGARQSQQTLGAQRTPGQQTGNPQIRANALVQPKTVAPPTHVRKPLAPPAYRPQQPPKVLQTKMPASRPASQSGKPGSTTPAPPAYRPQPVPKVLQTKAAVGHQPVSPLRPPQPSTPVHSPQPVPKVLQSQAAARASGAVVQRTVSATPQRAKSGWPMQRTSQVAQPLSRIRHGEQSANPVPPRPIGRTSSCLQMTTGKRTEGKKGDAKKGAPKKKLARPMNKYKRKRVLGTGRELKGHVTSVETLSKHSTGLLDAYRVSFKKKHNKETKEKLDNVTSTVSVFYDSDDESMEEDLIATPQRTYKVKHEKAKEDNITVLPRSPIPNIHAEMASLHHVFTERLFGERKHLRLRSTGPSKQICFLCQIMLKIFNVQYNEGFTSKILYPSWKDPTGYVKNEKGLFHTPRTMLMAIGMNVEQARARLSGLLKSAPNGLIDAILDGALQGTASLQKTIAALIKADNTLTKGSERSSTGKTVRNASRNTKQGRRILAEQARVRREMRKQEQEAQAKILELLKARKLKPGPDIADGDCLFHAIRHQLHRLHIQIDIQALRQRIVQLIAENQQYFAAFTQEGSVDLLIQQIGTMRSWNNQGGDVAAEIIATVLQRDIVVVSPNGVDVRRPNNTLITSQFSTVNRGDGSPITIAYNGVNHYWATDADNG
ncbi:MAG TPA: hypothetical protein VKB86_06955 [Pyrinomonadaceae bacterium]|nr:hypothetical protein [Pyrinomonadaceae bacterium]